jgi:hypothetical protein
MTTVIFPSEIDKYDALLNLWNATEPLGMGYLHSSKTPTYEDAKEQLEENYVDYFFGKPIKCDFANYPNLQNQSYDRDAGVGTMQKVANNTASYKGASKELTTSETEELINKCKLNISIERLN